MSRSPSTSPLGATLLFLPHCKSALLTTMREFRLWGANIPRLLPVTVGSLSPFCGCAAHAGTRPAGFSRTANGAMLSLHLNPEHATVCLHFVQPRQGALPKV